MPKAFFFNLPAHGHINPALPLIAELVQRGFDITCYATENFRQRIEATGARLQFLAGVEDDYFERHGMDGSTPQEAARLLLATTARLLPDLLEITRTQAPDLILYDCMCPWGYYLGRITRLPSVSSFSLIPMTASALRDWRVMRPVLPRLFSQIPHAIVVNRLGRTLQRRYGVKPLGATEIFGAPGDLSIVYSSPLLVPHAARMPSHFRFVGCTPHDVVAAAPHMQTSDRPLIYASLGTIKNRNKAFYNACIAAFSDSAYDLLISTGGRFAADAFGALPPNITVREWVPQAQVLQQASLFITHAGVNSIHDGLCCDVPLLLVPQQAEQTFNAIAVEDAGAGVRLRSEEANAEAIRAGALQLLSDSRYKENARRLGASLRDAGGARRAADEIEALLAARNARAVEA